MRNQCVIERVERRFNSHRKRSMLIHVVHRNAEQQLLDRLENVHGGPVHWAAFHFAGAALPVQPDEASLLVALRPLVGERSATLYFLAGGDILVTFNGTQKTLIDALCNTLYAQYRISPMEMLHTYYDAQAQGEELRNLCKKRMAMHAAVVDEPAPAAAPLKQPIAELRARPAQLLQFHETCKKRLLRSQPEILIVEDQPFSIALLHGVLKRHCTVHAAPNAPQGWEMYLEYAPDMVFLDIEMPGMNGHHLAAAVQRVDQDAFIVMVTGNHYEEDVARARQNGAKGFIAKPYNKLKIMEAIQKFAQQKKK